MNNTDQTHPSILVVNVHKGASSFIADEFAEAVKQVVPDVQVTRFGSEVLLGSEPSSMPIPPESSMFVRVYPGDIDRLEVETVEPVGPQKLEGLKLVLMYRDPRDAAVSLYYSAAFSHSTAVADKGRFLEMREKLRAVSVSEAIQSCSRTAIAEFSGMLQLIADYPEAMVCSYEELVLDYDNWLTRFVEHVGWGEEIARSLKAVTGDPFVPPGEVDNLTHRRRVTPGNWIELFDEELRILFEDAIGDEMRSAGYNWIEYWATAAASGR